jgi:hypothetical protein
MESMRLRWICPWTYDHGKATKNIALNLLVHTRFERESCFRIKVR